MEIVSFLPDLCKCTLIKVAPSNTNGVYDSYHVRRGDFQFQKLGKLWNQSKDEATDEKQKDFFDLMKDHYDITFLDDYMHLAGDINPNFYEMLDQLVASKGRTFFGCWWSVHIFRLHQ